MTVHELTQKRSLSVATVSGGKGAAVSSRLAAERLRVDGSGVLSPGDDVIFTILGVAPPKGSRTQGRRKTGSVYLRPASKGEHAFVEAVAVCAMQVRAAHGQLPAPYSVSIEFFLPRPKRAKYGWPTSSGDVDKLSRAVLDGLVRGQLLVDDRHVTEISAVKLFVEADGEPRTVVALRTLPACAAEVASCA